MVMFGQSAHRRRRRGFYNLLDGGIAPNEINGLALWLNGSVQAYSDTAGTVPANAPAGRVRRIDQPIPVGSWLAASDIVRPFREATALAVNAGLNISRPAGVTLPANDCTIGVSFTNWDNAAPYSAGFMGSDGVADWGFSIFQGNLIVYREGSFWSTGIGMPGAANPGVLASVSFVLRFTAAGCNIEYRINGVPGTATESTILSVRTATNLIFGSAIGEQFHGAVGTVVGYSRAISDVERTQLMTYLVSNTVPASFPVAAPLVAVVGDSLARGFSVNRNQSWAFKLLPNLYATAPARLLDTAVSGNTIAQQSAAYAAQVLPHRSASRAKNILIAAMGTNSLATGSGLSAAQCLTQYWAYCDQARADGWLVVAQTVSPRTDVPFGNAPYEANRLTYNAGILADWASHADALADIGNVATMALPADIPGTKFLGDLVHYNATGHTAVEALYRTAVLSLL